MLLGLGYFTYSLLRRPDSAQTTLSARELVTRALGCFNREAKALERHLAKHPYLVGGGITLADYSVAAPLFYAERVGFPLADYPKVREWFGRVSALPSWKETAPQFAQAA